MAATKTQADQLADEIFQPTQQADISQGQGGRSPPARPEPVAVWDTIAKAPWMKNTRGWWVEYGISDLKRVLRFDTYRSLSAHDNKDRKIEEHIMDMQRTLDVEYAGIVAGYPPGLRVMAGKRVLVSKGPDLIKPRRGKWEALGELITGLLGDQAEYFYGWMKVSLASLERGPRFVPGQMLVFAGPAGCGKSLLQNLITEMLGGRSAGPFDYMTGETNFNADLVEAEHLMIEDEAASSDSRIRRYFGAKVKTMLYNETQRIHGKGRKGLKLCPFWRITLSVNDEPENLMVLPMLDESLMDKVMLFLCNRATFPYSDDDQAGREEYREQLSSEIPAFIAWLRSWKIPRSMHSQRSGVLAWHHPELLSALDGLSPEAKLLSLIDILQIWEAGKDVWTGTAQELEGKLLGKDQLGRVAKLLSFNTACGAYLARLAKSCKDRVSKGSREGNKTPWTIKKEKSEPLPL